MFFPSAQSLMQEYDAQLRSSYLHHLKEGDNQLTVFYILLFSILKIRFCLHLVPYCILSKTFALMCFSKYVSVQENTDGECVIYVCLFFPWQITCCYCSQIKGYEGNKQ